MKINQNSVTPFIDVIGTQNLADGTRYRLLNYSISKRVDDALLLYNTLSCEMVMLEGDEIQQMLSLPYLIEHWFVVPEDFDDQKFARQYREIRELMYEQPTATTGYTILPTTDCNARCFYCYELGRSRIKMTETTAIKVADYIIYNYKALLEEIKNKEKSEETKNEELTGETKKNDHADKAKKEISLDWFGGEPLYNSEAIDTICYRLREHDVPYRSKMVSNSYLFSPELIQKATTLWNLKRVQVTLDGTEETYNRSKAYIHKEGSAFQRVMDNITLLLDAEIAVVVRMNIDMHNAEDLKKLAHLLKDHFGGRKGFSCYSHPLFEVSSPTAHLRTTERRALVYRKQQELEDLLVQLRLTAKGGKLLKDIPFNSCMSDSHQSVVIAPTGQIGLCEHYTDNEFFSHIDTPDTRDLATYNKFQERCEDIELCHDCPVYPQCIRLKMCEEGSLCFPEIRQQKIDNIKKAMLAKYERWKKKADADPDSSTSSGQAPDEDNYAETGNC